MYLESCCVNLEEVKEACRNGASRIELCERIDLGGITPSRQLIEEALSVSSIPINIMIRPRGGDFVYSEEEIAKMTEDIKFCKSLRISKENAHEKNAGKYSVVNGVVFGALTKDRYIDTCSTRILAGAASADSLSVRKCIRESAEEALYITFHRAFDRVGNPQEALEEIIKCGCTHLLTSGNMEDAFAGRFNIARLVEQAAGRITIIAGKGIRKNNLQQIAEDSLAAEFHGTSLF